MIDAQTGTEPRRHFQDVAWNWVQSGEITRSAHLLSPLEELAGFPYGFSRLDVRMPGAWPAR